MKLVKPRAPFIWIEGIPGLKSVRTVIEEANGLGCRRVCARGRRDSWMMYGPWDKTYNGAIRKWNKMVSRIAQKERKDV